VTCRRCGFFLARSTSLRQSCASPTKRSASFRALLGGEARKQKKLGFGGPVSLRLFARMEARAGGRGPMEKGIGWDSLEGLEGRWNYGDLESE
jgi:hypothetical protein